MLRNKANEASKTFDHTSPPWAPDSRGLDGAGLLIAKGLWQFTPKEAQVLYSGTIVPELYENAIPVFWDADAVECKKNGKPSEIVFGSSSQLSIVH